MPEIKAFLSCEHICFFYKARGRGRLEWNILILIQGEPMYFIPEKGRFYRWVAHIPPLYRYGMTCAVVGALAAGWIFVLSPWLTSLVQFEQAAVVRATQQVSEDMAARAAIAQRDEQITKVNETMKRLSHEGKTNDTVTSIFDAASKAHLLVNSFIQEKEVDKKWRLKKYASLAAHGTIQQQLAFLNTLQASKQMIQCTNYSMQRSDQDQFTMHCTLECIQPTI